MLIGGEGIFNTVVKGPGKVILQTMSISKVAELLTPFFADKKQLKGKRLMRKRIRKSISYSDDK